MDISYVWNALHMQECSPFQRFLCHHVMTRPRVDARGMKLPDTEGSCPYV